MLRDAYGVDTGKESTEKFHDDKKVKDLDAQGKERAYERHSGTGKQAFGNVLKKGGHGKGNYGKVNLKDFEGQVQEEEIDGEEETQDQDVSKQEPAKNKGQASKKKKKQSDAQNLLCG